MNVVTRGMHSALRSPLRSGAIILMLAISIGLIVSMLVARSGISQKIAEVKATTATGITINPAGIQDGMGGGNPLTSDQLKIIKTTAHIATVTSTLTDQLGTSDTNLTPSFTLGSFGKRMQRFSSEGGSSFGGDRNFTPPTPRTSVTGTSDPTTIVAADKLTSGKLIDGTSSSDVALVGASLATKNNLTVGKTFTAYGKTITVAGIFKVDNTFENNGIIMPIATLQTLTGQPGAVTSVAATADSSDNVATVVAALKKSLGSAADITSQQAEAEDSVKPLQSIMSLATGGVVAASLAGAIIILLAMTMIVRERRREIGVIKAIGGTNLKVITQFVIEAITITVLGAVVGFAFGVLVSGPITKSLVSSSNNSVVAQSAPSGTSRFGGHASFFGRGGAASGAFGQLRTNITDVTATVSGMALLAAAGLTLLIAIIGSAVPAWFIARIRPAEVLRTE